MTPDPSSLCSLPKLVQEDAVQFFSFFAEGNIYSGMSYDGRLYALHHSFRHHRRTDAFAFATALACQGALTVITVSPEALFYRVWLDLRFVASLRLPPSPQYRASTGSPPVQVLTCSDIPNLESESNLLEKGNLEAEMLVI